MSDCLFCRIVAGEVPSDRVLEDEQIIAFRDIDPQAPTHVLVIPRRHVPDVGALTDADADLLAALFRGVRQVVAAESLRSYRIVTNTGAEAGQSVDHLHLHVLGGRPMTWPPG